MNLPSVNLSSVNSYYNDGKWYDVSITRTLKNASLHITPFSGDKENDYVTTSRVFPLYLPSAEYVYFGGTKENR